MIRANNNVAEHKDQARSPHPEGKRRCCGPVKKVRNILLGQGRRVCRVRRGGARSTRIGRRGKRAKRALVVLRNPFATRRSGLPGSAINVTPRSCWAVRRGSVYADGQLSRRQAGSTSLHRATWVDSRERILKVCRLAGPFGSARAVQRGYPKRVVVR